MFKALNHPVKLPYSYLNENLRCPLRVRIAPKETLLSMFIWFILNYYCDIIYWYNELYISIQIYLPFYTHTHRHTYTQESIALALFCFSNQTRRLLEKRWFFFKDSDIICGSGLWLNRVRRVHNRYETLYRVSLKSEHIQSHDYICFTSTE